MFRFLLGLFLLVTVSVRAAEPGFWAKLELRTVTGDAVAPSGHWVVVVFISPECPVANADIPVLNALAVEFGPRGFVFLGAYADPGFELADLRRHAADYKLGFPAVDDRRQHLLRAAGATQTPEACVFTAAGELLYRGRIDNRVEDFGAARPRATREDLREVLAALAAGRPGPFPHAPGFGCTIPLRPRP